MMMRKQTTRVFQIAILSAVLSSAMDTVCASDPEKSWAMHGIESFEMYCFATSAKYEQVEKISVAMKLRPLPEDMAAAMGAANGDGGKAYFVKWDLDKNEAIFLGISKPDSCSVQVIGASIDDIRDFVQKHYKLSLAIRDDTGLQVREAHVPAGGPGNKIGAAKNGVVMLSYPKPETGHKTFTIGYLPPQVAIQALLFSN